MAIDGRDIPLPRNAPDLVEDVPSPAAAVAASIRPWREVFDEMGKANQCSLYVWCGFVVGVLLMSFGGITGAMPLVYIGAGAAGPCAILFSPWALVPRLDSSSSPEYNSADGAVGARKVHLEEAEQLLNQLRSSESEATVKLLMAVECYHVETQGFGNDAVTKRVVTHSDSKTFEVRARPTVVCDNQMYHSPLTSLEFVDRGVAFGDRETRDAFIASWDAFYGANRERDENISMTLSISRHGAPTSLLDLDKDDISPISERFVIVVADETYSGLQWYESKLSGFTCVNFWLCCGMYALCRGRHTMRSRADVWMRMSIRRGKGNGGEGDAVAAKMKASSAVAASAPTPAPAAPKRRLSTPGVSRVETAAPPPPRAPTRDIEMGRGAMAL